jgi:hypothetical protein
LWRSISRLREGKSVGSREYGGPREWVLTAALAEAARGPRGPVASPLCCAADAGRGRRISKRLQPLDMSRDLRTCRLPEQHVKEAPGQRTSIAASGESAAGLGQGGAQRAPGSSVRQLQACGQAVLDGAFNWCFASAFLQKPCRTSKQTAGAREDGGEQVFFIRGARPQ